MGVGRRAAQLPACRRSGAGCLGPGLWRTWAQTSGRKHPEPRPPPPAGPSFPLRRVDASRRPLSQMWTLRRGYPGGPRPVRALRPGTPARLARRGRSVSAGTDRALLPGGVGPPRSPVLVGGGAVPGVTGLGEGRRPEKWGAS